MGKAKSASLPVLRTVGPFNLKGKLRMALLWAEFTPVGSDMYINDRR